MKKLFFLFIFFLLLSSCAEEKKDAVVTNSPDGNIKLSVSVKRDNRFSPWTTDLVAEGKGLKGNVSFEFYAGEVSNKTVNFTWEGNEKCIITFTQSDKTQRIFEFLPNSTEAMWKDVSPK